MKVSKHKVVLPKNKYSETLKFSDKQATYKLN